MKILDNISPERKSPDGYAMSAKNVRTNPCTQARRLKAPVLHRILLLLEKGEQLNKFTAADRAFCDQRTAQRYLQYIYQQKLVRISDWERRYGYPLPTYEMSDKRDKKKPEPFTMDQKRRRYLSKPGVKETISKKKRIKTLIKSTLRRNKTKEIFNLLVAA